MTRLPTHFRCLFFTETFLSRSGVAPVGQLPCILLRDVNALQFTFYTYTYTRTRAVCVSSCTCMYIHACVPTATRAHTRARSRGAHVSYVRKKKKSASYKRIHACVRTHSCAHAYTMLGCFFCVFIYNIDLYIISYLYASMI